MRRRRWYLLFVGIAMLAGVLLWREVSLYWVESHPGEVDHRERSSDLAADLRLMWATQKLRATQDPNHGPNPRASSDRAINAASRVFNTVRLIGKTREQVVELLGDPRSLSDSIYNFPFHPTPNGNLVYRFDNGMYGWQFNVVFGDDGTVQVVERRWIH